MCKIDEEIRAEGIEIGMKKAQVEIIRRMMKNKNLSFTQACDYVFLSPDERTALQKYFPT